MDKADGFIGWMKARYRPAPSDASSISVTRLKEKLYLLFMAKIGGSRGRPNACACLAGQSGKDTRLTRAVPGECRGADWPSRPAGKSGVGCRCWGTGRVGRANFRMAETCLTLRAPLDAQLRRNGLRNPAKRAAAANSQCRFNCMMSKLSEVLKALHFVGAAKFMWGWCHEVIHSAAGARGNRSKKSLILVRTVAWKATVQAGLMNRTKPHFPLLRMRSSHHTSLTTTVHRADRSDDPSPKFHAVCPIEYLRNQHLMGPVRATFCCPRARS